MRKRFISYVRLWNRRKNFSKNTDESRKLMRRLAVDCYTKATNKNFAPAFYRLGNLAEDVQDFENAIKFYQSAV